jgi:hypothetical protein
MQTRLKGEATAKAAAVINNEPPPANMKMLRTLITNMVSDHSKKILDKITAIEQRQIRCQDKKQQGECPSKHQHSRQPATRCEEEEEEATAMKVKQQSHRTRQCCLQCQDRKEKVWWTSEAKTEDLAFSQKLTSITVSIHEAISILYGFVADPTKSSLHNAAIGLSLLPIWYYLEHPQPFSTHEHTRRHPPPHNYCLLLGLGFTFCPSPTFSTANVKKKNRSLL